MRHVILIIGKNGTGKTLLTKHLVNKSQRTLIVDPMIEYRSLGFNKTGNLINEHKRLGFPKIFTYRLESNQEKEVTYLMRYAWSLSSVLVVIEEAHLYLDSHNEYFNALIHQGRHRNISIIATVQAAVDVPKRFRRAATSMFVFQMTEPTDIDHLRDWGLDADKIPTLQRAKYPAIPVVNENYLVMGNDTEQITFETKAEVLSGRSYLEID